MTLYQRPCYGLQHWIADFALNCFTLFTRNTLLVLLITYSQHDGEAHNIAPCHNGTSSRHPSTNTALKRPFPCSSSERIRKAQKQKQQTSRLSAREIAHIGQRLSSASASRQCFAHPNGHPPALCRVGATKPKTKVVGFYVAANRAPATFVAPWTQYYTAS